MAGKCAICNRGSLSGNLVSHSMRHSRRTWEVNLRRVRAEIKGSTQHVMVCTRCLRSNKVKKVVS